jgi:hypothetical protein
VHTWTQASISTILLISYDTRLLCLTKTKAYCSYGAWDKQYKTRIDTGKTRIDTDWCKLVLRSVNFTTQARSCSAHPTWPCSHGRCLLPHVTIVDRDSHTLLHVKQKSTHSGAHVCLRVQEAGGQSYARWFTVSMCTTSRRSSTCIKCLVTTRRSAHQSALCTLLSVKYAVRASKPTPDMDCIWRSNSSTASCADTTNCLRRLCCMRARVRLCANECVATTKLNKSGILTIPVKQPTPMTRFNCSCVLASWSGRRTA